MEPIKVTKTEANYQHLLLDMMSKLVTEQKESNRLLRKMAGETENTNSKVTIFSSPRKNMAESIVSSPLERIQSVDNLHIDFENLDRSSMHCQLNSPIQNKSPNSPTQHHSPIREPFFRDRTNEPCQSLPSELTTKIDNFQNILNRIEEKVNQNQTLASQGPQGLLKAV